MSERDTRNAAADGRGGGTRPTADEGSSTPEAERGATRAWHALDVDEVLNGLASAHEGLSAAEAERRLERYGHNKLPRKQQVWWWQRLLNQFNSILIIILLIAGAISVALGAFVDAGAIFGVVLINAAIGYLQEGRAEKALQSIRGMLSPRATVRRQGQRRGIPAAEVVPGDIVIVESGDRVPADLRLVALSSLRAQEAALSGESTPVDKSTTPVMADTDLAERHCMAYAGTLVAQGRGEGVVVATGAATEIGHISRMIGEVEQVQTPLLRQLDRFGKRLAVIILMLAAAMAAFGVFVHGQNWEQMFFAAVGLAVAAIPQGLPAVISVTLALGVQAMARRNAIIRRLPAVETLGCISAIFTDKTGTLTRNEMTVTAIVLANRSIEVRGVGYAPEGSFRAGDDALDEPASEPVLRRCLEAGVLCNEATVSMDGQESWRVHGDPTEGALIVVAAKAGLDAEAVRRRHRRLDVMPFESERKYMVTLDRMDDRSLMVHAKGAPDVLLEMCDRVRAEDGYDELNREDWHERIDKLSSAGLRVLALAEKPGKEGVALGAPEQTGGFALLGIMGLIDPPRGDAARAVESCRKAGIRTKMVTGDHARTASAIAETLGLAQGRQVVTGKELEGMEDAELRQRVQEVDVFARASPEHKLRLVMSVQAGGMVCAMTGDGVNDAPALRRADVGVAMGINGTEASKEAAEMVLADDNFATIVSAVEEGRKVYDNIKKAVAFLLPTNGGESLAILVAVLSGATLPITPLQILWVNMVTAVTLGLALAFEPGEADVMRRPPRDPDAPILDLFLIWRVLFVSALLVVSVYGVFLWALASGTDISAARSAAVNTLVVGEIVYLLSIRRLTGRSLSFDGLFGSRPALIAIALVVLVQMAWTYIPSLQLLFGSAFLTANDWIIIGVIGLAIFLALEVEKSLWRYFSPAI